MADSSTPLIAEDLEDLFENAPCGYVSLDAKGRIVKANRTVADLLGIQAVELMGKRFRDLLTTPGKMFYETHFAPLLRLRGHFREVALDLVRADGQTVPVLAHASERRGEQGDLLFTRVALFQASERRKWERGLVEAKLTADAVGELAKSELDHERESSELREQFIAVLGNDLRNPLASISAAANLLSKEEQSQRSLRVIEMMRGSVHRMSGLMDNVLDFARGRFGGGIALSRDSHEMLEAVLGQVVAELLVGQPDRVIDADYRIDAPVFSDPGRIGQLASNLLGNALVHGAAGEPVRLTAYTEDGHMVIWVSNSGPPIPEDKMAKLFQPFFRGESRDNRDGLGLGLHIASEIARAHGGLLTVTSTDEETRFTFTMPLTISG